MDIDEAEREVARILTADVAGLARGRGVKPPSAGESWDVPSADRAALWSIGLPPPREDEYYGVVGAFQEGAPYPNSTGCTVSGTSAKPGSACNRGRARSSRCRSTRRCSGRRRRR